MRHSLARALASTDYEDDLFGLPVLSFRPAPFNGAEQTIIPPSQEYPCEPQDAAPSGLSTWPAPD